MFTFFTILVILYFIIEVLGFLYKIFAGPIKYNSTVLHSILNIIIICCFIFYGYMWGSKNRLTLNFEQVQEIRQNK